MPKKNETKNDQKDEPLVPGYFNLIHLKREKKEELEELLEAVKHTRQAIKDINGQMDNQEYELEQILQEKKELHATITLLDYMNEVPKEAEKVDADSEIEGKA